MNAGSLLFATPWLLASLVVSGAPPPHAGAEPACPAPARGFAVQAAMVVPLDAAWSEHLDTIPALLRGGAHADDSSDDAAIQDDAPAVQFGTDEAVAPPLEPIGTLASQRDSLSSHRILSRRSPRGPPVFR